MTLPRIECEQIDRFKASYSQQFGLDEKILKVTHHKILDNIQHGFKHCFPNAKCKKGNVDSQAKDIQCLDLKKNIIFYIN